MTPREIRSTIETVLAAVLVRKESVTHLGQRPNSHHFCVLDTVAEDLRSALYEITTGFNLDNDYSDIIAPAGWESVEA